MRVTFTRARPCSKQQPSGRTFTKGHCDVSHGLLLSPRLSSTHSTPSNRHEQLRQPVHVHTKTPRCRSPELRSPLGPTSPSHASTSCPPSPTRGADPCPSSQAFLGPLAKLDLGEAQPPAQRARLALGSRNPLRPITPRRPRDPPPPPAALMAHHGGQVRRERRPPPTSPSFPAGR